MKKIAVLASGEGTNFQSILDATRGGWIEGQVALLVSSRPQAGVLKRAQAGDVETLVAPPSDFKSPSQYAEHLAAACREKNVDLICLAGFLSKLDNPLVQAYPDRILNIHPALLPAFGGKGMYGLRVHEAVLESGAMVSGCTVHFVDGEYDHGPIVLQAAVPVLPEDTPVELARRVQEIEHWLYPQAIRLFCQGRLNLHDRRVNILPQDGQGGIRRAVVSVSDKTGIIEFSRGLERLGVEIVSTSGTAKALKESGITVRPLSSLTGFPEILGGRVKTLHPKIHGGILARRKNPSQWKEAGGHGIEPIDLVVVNLYPFAEAAERAASAWEPGVIEQIDIGGPSMIRAAAKNYEDVAVVTCPEDYPVVLAELDHSKGHLSLETRRRLVRTAFEHTASYDTVIARALRRNDGSHVSADATPKTISSPETVSRDSEFPPRLAIELVKAQDLRYGENPHQKGAVYRFAGGSASFEQLHGKELSYNNLLDAEGTWDLVSEFEVPAVVIFKHVTPCGVGIGSNLMEAWRKAWGSDPVSAFGGVMAVNRTLTSDLAEGLSSRFVEVVVAPGFEGRALEILKQKPNVRLLARHGPPSMRWAIRSAGEEVLVQEPDRKILVETELKVVTRRSPAPEEERALRFGWICAKHVRSNAIVLAAPDQTVGIGAGQMSRVDSVRMAGQKLAGWLQSNPKPHFLAMASDAFFPFRDGLDEAIHLGVTAVIQPGGSVRDREVIQAADEHGLAMVFTGIRHFRH